jgi:hypothetical protein
MNSMTSDPIDHPGDQEQALAVFNHAGEEIRFFKGQQWMLTNYALLAYGALAAAPQLIGDSRDVANWVWVASNLGCAVLVPLAGWLTWGRLTTLNDALNKERNRMSEAKSKLPLIQQIHSNFPPGDRNVTEILGVVLLSGALVAIGINLLRIRWARIVACLTTGVM